MNKRVNFEDNIFILMNRIRILRDLLSLDADPELFLEKTLDDMDFITQALGMLLRQLMENRHFIERSELFRDFEELEWQFSQVLSGFINSQGTLSIEDYPAIIEKIRILRSRSLERRRTAETAGGAPENHAGEPVVSSDELSELLKEY
jgi:FMN phosphatase YigB (HAD superfamily)